MITEFKKYPKIKQIGHEDNKDIFSDPDDDIYVEEKIDGGNFRFYVNYSGDIVFGSRTQQITSDEGEDTNVSKMFKRCVDYVREKLDGFNCSNGFIFYGEACFKHTINYDWDKMPPFLGFDIYDIDGGYFLDHYFKTKKFKHLGLETVPAIDIIKARHIKNIDDDMVPKSKYALESAQDQKSEGIVFKNYNKQIYAKYVRDKFKEKNAEAFGGNPKYNKVDDTNNAELVFKYCTNNRIDKMIFKLIDEGHNLEMGLMKHLPKRIMDDVFEEHWQEIYKSNWKIDFRQLRKLIPKRCKSVLQQVITNNALQ